MNSEITRITFGGWLKQRRKEQGISLDVIAERIGCSAITLLKMEAGERRPSRQMALLLATTLGIAEDEHDAFVTFARSKPESAPAPAPTDSAPTEAKAAVSDLPTARAPWRAAHLDKTNLPHTLTSLIGRETEIAEATGVLLQSRVRLLTMTGAPGIGKTRLALQVASLLLEQFDDGVFLVELATINDPEQILRHIARALGVKETGTSSIEEVLVDYVRERRMLLVLDNFEHLLDAAPATLKLLESSPWLKILVTSREPLHIKGERRFVVTSLKMPDLKELPGIKELERFPAVELFVERARTAQPSFKLTERNAASVAAICVRLDGLPMAIELAAGQTGLFSPEELVAQLDKRLNLLKTRERGLPNRQRTLRGAIDWSYNLLDAGEQALFRRLGVFVGEFSMEAATSVGGWNGQETQNIGDRLAMLLDKSLITRSVMPHNEKRLSILETLREYALEQLVAKGEEEKTRECHAEYYTLFVREASTHFGGAEQVEWLEKVEVEYNNIREALTWLVDARHAQKELERIELAAQICTSLFLFWEKRSYMSEARAWYKHTAERMSTLVEATGEHEHPGSAARALSPALPVLWARMLSGAGVMAYYQGDYAEAIELHKKGLVVRREIDDHPGVAASLNNLGNVASEQGDLEAARTYHSESLAIARAINDERKIGTSLNNLGIVEVDLGNFGRAREILNESLQMARREVDAQSIARTLNNLGIVARYQHDYAGAHTYHSEALALDQQLGQKRGVALTLVNMGYLALDEDDYPAARALFLEGLQIVRELGDKRVIAEAVEGIASIAAIKGKPELAAKLFGATNALRKAINAPLAPAEQKSRATHIQAARTRLSEATWETQWTSGQAMFVEEAITAALNV